MTIKIQPLAPDKDRALKEISRYLSSRIPDNKAESVVTQFNAYMKAGAFRRALVDSLTDDDIRRLCDVVIGLEKGRLM